MGDPAQTEGGDADKKQGQVLLITTVEIGDGQPENINVREGDDTYDVARDFVMKHGLPEDIIPELARHLHENLEAHMEQQALKALKNDNPVFSRLYQQAIDLRDKLDEQRAWVKEYELEVLRASKPRMTWISMAMMRDRSAGPFNNYGEMLYVESIQRVQVKQEKVQRIKEEMQAEETANMTFAPQLSPRSKMICSAQRDADGPPAWKRLVDMYKRAKERVEKKRQEKERKEEQACPFKPTVHNNLKSEKLAQKAVQRYMATSPRLRAVRATGAGGSDGSNSDINSISWQTVDAAPASPAPSPRKLSAIERLYGDAVRRMHKEREQAFAVSTKPQHASTNSPRKMSLSGKMSISGSYTGTLKRNALRSVSGAPVASSGGTIGAFEPRSTARAAARAAAAAISGSSNIECSRKTFGDIASCAGAVRSKQSIAGARASEAMLNVDGRVTVAGSIKALQTSPVRASAAGASRAVSMAGGVRPSMAGVIGKNQGVGQRKAWH